MRPLPLILAPLALLACSPEPEATPTSPRPAFALANNPIGDPSVYRYEDEFAVAWTDPGNGLRATHWSSRFFVEPGCGNFEGGPIGYQEVGLIDADDFFASQIRANVMGPVWIIVRDLNQPGDCFGNKLIAEGWGQAHYTDNDVFGLDSEHANANAWGYMGEGKLTAPDGSTRRYAGHLRIVVTADGLVAAARPEIFLR